jgi:phosphotriesterase-related protein
MLLMKLQTVTGLVELGDLGVIDGHAHAWITPPDQAPTRLELDNEAAIITELIEFGEAGGTALVDCQPGGCGRDARRLQAISERSGVFITATSGFHQQMYYPPGHWLWEADVETAVAYFRREITQGMDETDGRIPATTLKIGYEGVIAAQTRVLMEAVALVAQETGVAVLFHTERGLNIEALIPFFESHGVLPSQLYLCHVDKRPDFGLHRELAQAGVMLGYDTVVRPKYDPDAHFWPLLRRMVEAGCAGQVVICQDRALETMWRYSGDAQGMAALPLVIRARLAAEGFDEDTSANLLGRNVARFLVRRQPNA